MSKTQYRLRNVAGRPIEMHGAEEVSIIPANATIDLDEIGDVHAALIARGLLTCHTAAPPRPSPNTTKASAKSKSPTAQGASGESPAPSAAAKSPPKQKRAKATRAPRKSPAKPSRRTGDSA